MKSKSQGNVIPMNSQPIDSENVYDYVRSHLKFPITDEQWDVIDAAMDHYWNSHHPGATISSEENAAIIYDHCVKERMLISYDRIIEITNVIWEYLVENGFLIKY